MSNKIVMIHPALDLRGGAERKFILIYNQLIKDGYAVEIITRNYDKNKTFYELIESNINVNIITAKNKIDWFSKVFSEIRKKDYDIVVASNYPANIPVTLTKIFNSKLKTVWILNEIAVKLIRRESFIWNIYYSLEAKLNSYFDKVIVNSSYTANETKSYYDIEPSVVYSGVEIKDSIDQVNISSNISVLKDEKFIFCLSRMELHKNILFLENIAKEFPELKIVVAGGGKDQDYIEKITNAYSTVDYVGRINEDEKFYLMKNSKLFLFLPHNEPLGVTVMEALSQNTPVIAFNSGGPKETILNKKNGFLSDSDENYIFNIKQIIDNNFEVSEEYGREYIIEKFSNKRMQEDFAKEITSWK